LSPPVGPAGCEGGDEGKGRSAWLAGVSAGALRTRISFDSGPDTYFDEQVVVGSFGRRLGDVVSLRLGAGAIVGGRLVDHGLHYDLSPGWLVSATAAREWLGSSAQGWFVSTAVVIGVSGAHTTNAIDGRASLVAQDNRLSVVAGKTIAGVWSPYFTARAFGGPVFWRRGGQDVVGGDQHHYGIGAGGSFTIRGLVDVVGEATLIGEKTFTLGASFSFRDR
jgi:hypothetical protein